MKYIYTICILMSSFFTYKNSLAADNVIKYAFFVPQNAFQDNLNVNDINAIKPRYTEQRKKETHPQNSGLINNAQRPKVTLPYEKNIVVVDEPQKPAKQSKPKVNTQQATKNYSAPVKPKVEAKEEPLVAPIPPEINQETKEKLNKYSLDNDFGSLQNMKQDKPLDANEILKQDINKRLLKIPYPDRKLPNFKQCYEDYNADLRIFFHRGKFPLNKHQDDTLAKLSSSGRFKVE